MIKFYFCAIGVLTLFCGAGCTALTLNFKIDAVTAAAIITQLLTLVRGGAQ